MLHRLLWDLGVDNPDDDQAVNNKIREVEQRFHLVMILEHFEVTKVQMTFFLFMIGTITFESATSLNFQIFVQESLILMKNLLCWESEDIKNLKLNSRKVDESDQISLETRKLLEKLMEPDFRVYNHFKKKFFEKVQNLGDIEMREELADLDRVNTEITEKCDFKSADNSELRDALRE